MRNKETRKQALIWGTDLASDCSSLASWTKGKVGGRAKA